MSCSESFVIRRMLARILDARCSILVPAPPNFPDTRCKIQVPTNPPLSSPDEKLSCNPEPRSGERYIAWGVSPRIRVRIKEKAAERRQKCGADAIGSRRSTNLSPPPGACGLIAVPTLGLTPQAKNMLLLRSSSSGVNLFQAKHHLAFCILDLASWICVGGRDGYLSSSQNMPT
jgi:hypothetical protein